MSMWALILFAAVCFGISFALAHFTERLLFFVVGGASRRREGSPSSPIVHQDVAIANAGPGAAISGNEIKPASAATSSAATSSGTREDGLKGSPDSERPQPRVHHLRRTATARGFRTSARQRMHSRVPSHRESGADRQPPEGGVESPRPLADP